MPCKSLHIYRQFNIQLFANKCFSCRVIILIIKFGRLSRILFQTNYYCHILLFIPLTFHISPNFSIQSIRHSRINLPIYISTIFLLSVYFVIQKSTSDRLSLLQDLFCTIDLFFIKNNSIY